MRSDEAVKKSGKDFLQPRQTALSSPGPSGNGTAAQPAPRESAFRPDEPEWQGQAGNRE